ncbi:hypothetical protein M758_5G096900 [Ceratodon purpureus]|nr:hypothetical protein M758_5G096900 [Ceratodon purpureus]
MEKSQETRILTIQQMQHLFGCVNVSDTHLALKPQHSMTAMGSKLAGSARQHCFTKPNPTRHSVKDDMPTEFATTEHIYRYFVKPPPLLSGSLISYKLESP